MAPMIVVGVTAKEKDSGGVPHDEWYRQEKDWKYVRVVGSGYPFNYINQN